MTTFTEPVAFPAAHRYFEFLRTPYEGEEGPVYPAGEKYVAALRATHEAYRPRFDLTACLAGRAAGFSGRVFFWSDTHFRHKNLIEYCNRPYQDELEMDTALLSNCLQTVTARDILVFGGDICVKRLEEVNQLLRQIPAYKVNVLGNHDVHKKKLLALEVDETCACLEFDFEGTRYLVTHQPVSETVLAEGQVNIHGHIHDLTLHADLGSGARHINMSVEGIGYTPRTLPELLALKASGALQGRPPSNTQRRKREAL